MRDISWFGDIYERYNKWAMKLLMKRKFTVEEAEDFLHHVIVLILQREDLRKEGAISLFTQYIELASRQRLQRDRMRFMPREFDVVHSDTPEHRCMVQRDLRSLNNAIHSLPHLQRDLMIGRVRGSTAEEMANEGVSKTSCSYAFKLLRKNMKKINIPDREPNRAIELEEHNE